MEIYVLKDNEKKGPFSEDDIRSQVFLGIVKLEDQVWWQGQPAWITLGESRILRGEDPADPFSKPQLARSAVIAMVLGLIPFMFPFAIFVGFQARETLRRDRTYKGDLFAISGIVLGGLQIVVLLIWALSAYMAGFHKHLEEDPYAAVDSSAEYGKITPDAPDVPDKPANH